MSQFGKFPSIEAFLTAYAAEKQQRVQLAEVGLQLEARFIARRQSRDVVEVASLIAEVKPEDSDGAKHYRLHVVIKTIFQTDPDVDADLQSHLKTGERVFVAIRYGDRLSGNAGPIEGLVAGANIRLRGEWITAEHAYAIGGERLSVLHFTHPPIGFVAIGDKIYG
jgi:endonuclease G